MFPVPSIFIHVIQHAGMTVCPVETYILERKQTINNKPDN